LEKTLKKAGDILW